MARGILEFVRGVFVDMHLICTLMCVWLTIVIIIMTEIGIFSNPSFVAFGPRPTLMFMHVQVDTQYKYTMLVIMVIMHTIVSDFISDSLSPHILNHVQDVRNRYLPHHHRLYYAITSLWAVYCAVSQLFLIFLALGQLDLLIVRLLSDIAANMLTTSIYLKNKSYNPERFHEHEAREQQLQQHNNNNNNNNSAAPADSEDEEIVVYQKDREKKQLIRSEPISPPPGDV